MIRAHLPLLVALVLATAAPVAAAPCFTGPEAKASRVRQLQSELMVAALRCTGRPELGLTEGYNSFVRRFGPDLVDNARLLRGHFARNHPGQPDRLDAFITKLANAASRRSLDGADFCAGMSPVFEEVLALERDGLVDYAARAVVPSQPTPPCGAR